MGSWPEAASGLSRMGIRSYMTMLFKYKYIERSSLSVEASADIYEKLVVGGLFTPAEVTDPANRRLELREQSGIARL